MRVKAWVMGIMSVQEALTTAILKAMITLHEQKQSESQKDSVQQHNAEISL